MTIGTLASRSLQLVTALVAATLVLGCTDRGDTTSGIAARALTELRATSFGQHLGVQQPSHKLQDGEWTELYFDPAAEQAVCLTGDEFQVNFRRGTSDQVLLYLQGGGACWDHQSCYVDERALTTANGAYTIGALDIDDPASPFRDYSIVYVPYCDGSLFGGDTTVDYDGMRTFHHGLWNLSVAVDVLTREFSDAPRIVIAGSSAGGFGTVPGYAVTRLAFPRTPIVVFDDSGTALENAAAIPAADLRARNWRAAEHYPASCTECARHALYLFDWALTRDSALRVALYGYQHDAVIMDFFEFDDATYPSLLLSVSGDVRSRHPDRLQRYYAAGTGHTILPFNEFYTQTVDGVAIADWTRAFLDDGKGWSDVVE